MSAITPKTNLKLLKVPIAIDNKNQITFSNLTEQYNYFNSLNKIEADDFTYQRRDSVIRFPAHIDSIINYNYCMYQNENYTNKWFFAFITNMSYINDGLTDITIKTDVYQTWMFDCDLKSCFVEREHVNDDTVGLNTYPEGLEMGEYTNLESYEIGLPVDVVTLNHHYYTCIISSWDPIQQKETSDIICGIEQGGSFFLMDYGSTWYFMSLMASQSKNEAIIGAFVVPQELFYQGDYTTKIPNSWWNYLYNSGGISQYGYKKLDSTLLSTLSKHHEAIKMNEPSFYPANNLLDYNPKNNKLLTYPFSFIEITNNNGGNAIYRYEDFNLTAGLGQIKFLECGTITPGCSITLIPENYKNKNFNYEESLPHGKFPICSYQVDMYTNWLTQNSLQVGLSVGESILSTTVGAATGNPIAISSGLLGVANTLAEVDKQSKVPPQAEGNINNGDICYSSNNLRYTIYKRCIKKEYAEKIDNYFSMFGYKVNITKIPNIIGRTYFNYVKTIDANIEGYIPQADIEELKEMFNNGVTFWHDPNYFLDYSVNNTIVT